MLFLEKLVFSNFQKGISSYGIPEKVNGMYNSSVAGTTLIIFFPFSVRVYFWEREFNLLHLKIHVFDLVHDLVQLLVKFSLSAISVYRSFCRLKHISNPHNY